MAHNRDIPPRLVRFATDERVVHPSRMRRATQRMASEVDGVSSMMRLLDFFTSTRRPAAGTPTLAAHDLCERLMALNRPSAPYVLRPGLDENVDFIAEWSAGVPSLSLAASAFHGQNQEIQFGSAYAFTETLRPGEVPSRELKRPIQKAVTDGGWTYQGVAFGKL